MSRSLNKVMLIGNLGVEPEIKSLPSGNKVASMRIATTDSWKNRDTQERQERTEWHNISCFGDNLVAVIERYFKKGMRIYVEGSLQTRKWTDSTTGQDKYFTEIVVRGFGGQVIMLDRQGTDTTAKIPMSSPMSAERPSSDVPAPSAAGSPDTASDFDDEIPF